jgi:hypothetical protein
MAKIKSPPIRQLNGVLPVKVEDFVDRRSFHVFSVELPSLSRRNRAKAVREELERFYPEPLETKTIIAAKNGAKGRYLACVFNSIEKKNPLTLSTLAVLQIAGSSSGKMALVTDNWIEYVSFEQGSLTFTAVRERNECPLDAQIEKDTADMFGADNAGVRFLSGDELDRILHTVKRRAVSCYPFLLPSCRRKWLLAAFCVPVFLAAAVFFLHGFIEQKQIAAERARQEYALIKEKEEKQIALEKKLSVLEEQYARINQESRASVYQCLETIAASLEGGIQIIFSEFKRGTFRIEGKGQNVLSALEKLEKNPRIGNVVLNTVSWEKDSLAFSAAGTVAIASAANPKGLLTEEKIAWYEVRMADFNVSQSAPPGASAAARAARLLLEENGCRIKLIRFLPRQETAEAEKDNPGDILKLECSFSSGAKSLVASVAGAENANSFFSADSLSTRNRGAEIDSVLVLSCRIAQNSKKLPAETVPVARIAALYQIPLIPAPANQRVNELPVKNNLVFMPVTEKPPAPSDSAYLGFIEIEDSSRITYLKDRDGKIRRGDVSDDEK